MLRAMFKAYLSRNVGITTIVFPIAVAFTCLISSERWRADADSLASTPANAFDVYVRTPVTLIDLGVSNLRQNLFHSFAMHKPRIFERENYIRVGIDLDISSKKITASSAHYSDEEDEKGLVGECKEDIDLILSGMTPAVAYPLKPKDQEEAQAAQDRQCYVVEEMFGSLLEDQRRVSDALNPPDQNICRSLRIVAHVHSRSSPRIRVMCAQMFYDKQPEVTIGR